MFEPLAIPPLNRLLRSNAWALKRLRPHAGKTAVLVCPPWEVRVAVSETGELAVAPSDAAADVVIGTTPGLLLRVASGEDAAWGEAKLEGDIQLAGAIDYVRRNLRWDYEETLSRFLGDIAAHRIAGAVHAADQWRRTAGLNFARSVAEYAAHEDPQIASAEALEEFNAEVDRTRDDVDRLEKRIELLSQRLSSGDQPPGRST
jgi:ubiquinone biosynthesis protein UbiJ